jgi:hypothetical protein
VKRKPRQPKRPQRELMKPYRKMLRAQRQAGAVLHYVPPLLALPVEQPPMKFGHDVKRDEDGAWVLHHPEVSRG